MHVSVRPAVNAGVPDANVKPERAMRMYMCMYDMHRRPCRRHGRAVPMQAMVEAAGAEKGRGSGHNVGAAYISYISALLQLCMCVSCSSSIGSGEVG